MVIYAHNIDLIYYPHTAPKVFPVYALSPGFSSFCGCSEPPHKSYSYTKVSRSCKTKISKELIQNPSPINVIPSTCKGEVGMNQGHNAFGEQIAEQAKSGTVFVTMV